MAVGCWRAGVASLGPERITTYSDRGFGRFVNLAFDGGRLRLYESSSAMEPSWWLNIEGGSFEVHLTPPYARALLDGFEEWFSMVKE